MTETSNELSPRTIRAADLVEPFAESPQLSLLDVPLAVEAREDPDGTRYDVRLDHEPFDLLRLHAFLTHLAPSPGDTPIGIVDDWSIIDMATRKTTITDYAKRLVSSHEHLGDAWGEFMASREAFLDVMSDGRQSYGFDIFASLLTDNFIGVGSVIRQAARRPDYGRPILARVFEAEGKGDSQTLAFQALRGAINHNRQPNRRVTDPVQVERLLNKQSFASRYRTLKALVAALPEDTRSSYLEAGKRAFFVSAELADGTIVLMPRASIEGDFAEQLAQAQTIRRGKYVMEVASVRIRLNRGEKQFQKHRIIIPGSERAVEGVSRIAPRLAWLKTSSGERRFIIERDIALGDRPEYQDGVLGVLLAAYFNPKLCSDWPKEMSIRGSRQQRIGAAQVPVLALFPHVKKQLLGSPFIEAAEKLVA